MAMLSAVVAVSFLPFHRCGVPLHPLVPLSSVSFSATEVHWDWGVIVASWGIGRVELVVGLLVTGAWVAVLPVLLEGTAIVFLVL